MDFKWVAPVMALALAGCGGGNSRDFTIAVDGQRADVVQEFVNMQPGLDLPGVRAITMESDGPSLTFTIPSAEGYDDGEVRMDFAQNGKRTMIDVSVDVPKIMMGGAQFLSEELVEKELEKNLRDWAERYSTSPNASVAEFETNLGIVAIAAQRVDVDNIVANHGAGMDFAAWEGEMSGWGEDSSLPEGDYGSDSGWAESGDDGGWGAGQ
ncbi:hypothetical protein [Qipengyuania sphaerica]|uniref:hypothetical protein n=1 Tax=Qipengyuania sphaerica TaxID=2867243 RepID=UPI001C86EFE3|nr:hypothetical protein [Qipengyuania sphaerica]MBX7541489.1 hypothetical protein [Qipengyuania sphaerica]